MTKAQRMKPVLLGVDAAMPLRAFDRVRAFRWQRCPARFQFRRRKKKQALPERIGTEGRYAQDD